MYIYIYMGAVGGIAYGLKGSIALVAAGVCAPLRGGTSSCHRHGRHHSCARYVCAYIGTPVCIVFFFGTDLCFHVSRMCVRTCVHVCAYICTRMCVYMYTCVRIYVHLCAFLFSFSAMLRTIFVLGTHICTRVCVFFSCAVYVCPVYVYVLFMCAYTGTPF